MFVAVSASTLLSDYIVCWYAHFFRTNAHQIKEDLNSCTSEILYTYDDALDEREEDANALCIVAPYTVGR